MTEPRPVQRLERLKKQANKYIHLLSVTTDHPSAARWHERLQETVMAIEILEHEAKAALVKQVQKEGGVDIRVPTVAFALKPAEVAADTE